MYVVKNGLPKYMLPLAYFFAFFGMIGCLAAFQSNQIVQITKDLYFENIINFEYFAGIFLMVITALVILGGLKRIATVASWLVPFMAGLYLIVKKVIAILLNFESFIPSLLLIFSEAFNANSAISGGIAGVIITGIRRGAFSNEAGIGTEAMIHGAAKTSHPVKQGLVAMTGPIFDTLIMCTLTALVILVSGVWQDSGSTGVTLTSEAFSQTLGPIGSIILFMCIKFWKQYNFYSITLRNCMCKILIWRECCKTISIFCNT